MNVLRDFRFHHHASTVLPVSTLFDGSSATVLYAGSAPGLIAGVTQINLAIPEALGPGAGFVSPVSPGPGIPHSVQIQVGDAHGESRIVWAVP